MPLIDLVDVPGSDSMVTAGLALPGTSADNIIHLLRNVAVAAGGSLAVLILTYLVARWLSGRMQRGLGRAGFALNLSILLSRGVWIAVWSVGVVWILYIFGVGLAPLAAFIGIVGLAASLSLQTLLQNLVAGVYLLAERPFNRGDIIAVVGPSGANHTGMLESVELRTTNLRSFNDELILVPNSAVFTGIVTNYTLAGGYAMSITVTFPRETEVSSVDDSLLPVITGVPSVLKEPRPEIRVLSVEKDVWTACLTFWASNRRVSSEVVWAVARAFPEASVKNEVEN